MNTLCTILIPTHNRVDYLNRCVRWFLELGYPIVIADSSQHAWQSDLRQHEAICYVHCAGGLEVYPAKLQQALAKVHTPFVAMCADDDFTTGEGLAVSIDFLERHPGYSFSQGYAYTYQLFGRRLVVWPMPYDYHDVHKESWIERVEGPLSTVYYGVLRTEVLRDGVEFLVKQDFGETFKGAPGFFDFCLTAYAARRGKFKRCSVPFGLREYSPQTTGVGSIYQTITSRNVADFYRNLETFLMGSDQSEEARTRLRKHFAKDYAGQILYDLSPHVSKKRFVRHLPDRMIGHVEYFYRLYYAARCYVSANRMPFVKLFFGPDYARFKQFVLQGAR
jgi:glycosyltransferase domain-containing protein